VWFGYADWPVLTPSIHPDSFGSYLKTSTDVSDRVIADNPNPSIQAGPGALGCDLEDSAIRFPDPHLSRDNASIDEVVRTHGVDLRPLALTIAIAHHRNAKAAVASPAKCIGCRLVEGGNASRMSLATQSATARPAHPSRTWQRRRKGTRLDLAH
jgi:hypothetical protein